MCSGCKISWLESQHAVSRSPGECFCDPLTTIVPDHMPGLISGIGRWVKYSQDRNMTPTKNPMNVGNEWCSPSNCEGSRVSPFPKLVSFSMHCSIWITKRDHFFTRPRGSYHKIPLPHLLNCLPSIASLVQKLPSCCPFQGRPFYPTLLPWRVVVQGEALEDVIFWMADGCRLEVLLVWRPM